MAGETGAGEVAVGVAFEDVPLAFSSISARSFRVPPGVASFCFSFSSCFFFHAASLARRSAFLSVSDWAADFDAVSDFEIISIWRPEM